jgi:hypothetical protein
MEAETKEGEQILNEQEPKTPIKPDERGESPILTAEQIREQLQRLNKQSEEELRPRRGRCGGCDVILGPDPLPYK